MSDRDLEAKFRDLCTIVLDDAAIDAVIAACWTFEKSADSGALARLTVPAKYGPTPLSAESRL
jgi:hypothetical protein